MARATSSSMEARGSGGADHKDIINMMQDSSIPAAGAQRRVSPVIHSGSTKEDKREQKRAPPRWDSAALDADKLVRRMERYLEVNPSREAKTAEDTRLASTTRASREPSMEDRGAEKELTSVLKESHDREPREKRPPGSAPAGMTSGLPNSLLQSSLPEIRNGLSQEAAAEVKDGKLKTPRSTRGSLPEAKNSSLTRRHDTAGSDKARGSTLSTSTMSRSQRGTVGEMSNHSNAAATVGWAMFGETALSALKKVERGMRHDQDRKENRSSRSAAQPHHRRGPKIGIPEF
eukprot:gnl/MRDRNA2_/MRDRNA2_187852_c0_seq1.p1 gnl/MRDRNA2_/MRDRNA2_187852_c0~~gnl/MRDRNA2_/MRDRNA2_187852_c0_seq1.p1  ORF type:complete len:312 (-),score=46.94 gnl/MRDRNA2_/MRDRNA2_187852_c0_seq1:160-1026(-)